MNGPHNAIYRVSKNLQYLIRKTRVFQAGVCLAVCLSLTGCDVLYHMLHKEGAEEKALLGDIVPFEKNLAVEEVQALLSIYGYSPGKLDGVMGLQTRNALEEFQRDNGLKETRFVDKATWRKLSVFKENNLIVKNKLNVKLVQTALAGAGFDPGPIDGKMGAKTRKAITGFQREAGLTADGKIGYQTLLKLSEFVPADSGDPQEEPATEGAGAKLSR